MTNSATTSGTLIGNTLASGAGTYAGTITDNTAGGGTLGLVKGGRHAHIIRLE